MYINILNVLTGLLGVIGTIYAVLSILNISFESLDFSLTLAGIGSRDEEMLFQKEQARIGVALVTLSFAFESINCFLNIGVMRYFIICLVIEIFISVVVVIFVNKGNKKFRKEYEARKSNRRV